MNDNFLKVAKEVAITAGEITLQYFGKKHQYNIKGQDNSNFATKADLEAEKAILKIINDNFPDHGFISEEAGVEREDAEYVWVIDPLDGTVVFAAGLVTFTISIGLLKMGKPILGVVYQPVTDELYYAQKDQGAYLNNEKIRVSKETKLEKSVLGIDFAHREKRMRKTQKYILPLLEKIRWPLAIGSDALLFALVGKGVLDGFATETNIWDCIAGAVIVSEAGGMITDGVGQEIDWSKRRIEIVASNGLIHNQILEALKG